MKPETKSSTWELRACHCAEKALLHPQWVWFCWPQLEVPELVVLPCHKSHLPPPARMLQVHGLANQAYSTYISFLLFNYHRVINSKFHLKMLTCIALVKWGQKDSETGGGIFSQTSCLAEHLQAYSLSIAVTTLSLERENLWRCVTVQPNIFYFYDGKCRKSLKKEVHREFSGIKSLSA